MSGKKKTAIITGAGPAGLTAALELLRRTDIIPIVLEASNETGGISRTVNYKGYRMDIGGHRFFSKSDRVMNWWMDIMPVQASHDEHITINYHGSSRDVEISAHADGENVMLIRNRVSRIYYLRKFFSYPIKLSLETLTNLGAWRTIKIITSYLNIRLFPIKNEQNLEDYIINRFGKELYNTFFKDYTEKVWGLPCNQISAEWGAQRIKGVSIYQAVKHAMKQVAGKKDRHIGQKDTETSLIERFMYPKYGPGHLWETVAQEILKKGGQIMYNTCVCGVNTTADQVLSVIAKGKDGEMELSGDYFFSTMPVKDLVNAFNPPAPTEVQEVANGLQYRDFITVGLLLNKLSIEERTGKKIDDNWIYIQDNSVKLGRLQIFNNWSPFLVPDENKIWIGLEYFCNETDELWLKTEEEMKKFATSELVSIGFINEEDVIDGTVIRVPKTYPAYFGTYEQFGLIRNYTERFENLFLVGRNGMHKYNNQDHSMLTAMTAVDNIISGRKDKDNLWEINTEMEYHEEKK
jgi:protoporphyrinogen oxidase